MSIEIIEETPIRAHRDSGLLKSKYIGKNPELVGTRGGSYFSSGDDSWMYKPTGTSKFYAVDLDDIEIA